MKITVLGFGRIGLPTSLLLASKGHNVIGVDVDPNKIKFLVENRMPFEESGLLYISAKPSFRSSMVVE